MKHLVLAGVLLASVTLFSCDKGDDDNEMDLNTTDRNFITGASISNNAEIQTGQLAAAKATDAGIKAYGQRMVAEHSLAQAELKGMANRVGIVVVDSVDAQHRALAQYLNTLSGREFDSVYINSQVADHQNTLNLFQTELGDGDNDSVQAYANKYQPHIQMHLAQADSLAEAL